MELGKEKQGQVKQALRDKLGDNREHLPYKEFLEVISELSADFMDNYGEDSLHQLRDWLEQNHNHIMEGQEGFPWATLPYTKREFWEHLDHLLFDGGGLVWEIMDW